MSSAEGTSAAEFVVAFERIGRNRNVPPLTVRTATDMPGQEVAEAVYRHAGRFLGSKDYEVDVDLEAGTVLLGWGRFGRGTVASPCPHCGALPTDHEGNCNPLAGAYVLGHSQGGNSDE